MAHKTIILSQALRSIGEPIFGQSIKNISAGRLLAQLFEITEKFNMATQPQLLLLQKNMVVVEGVARSLDENANIWEITKPILEGWLTRQMSTKNKIDQLIPGLTGWAQVNGRDELSIESKLQLDIDYMKNKSFLFDLKIIWLTILRVISTQDISH